VVARRPGSSEIAHSHLQKGNNKWQRPHIGEETRPVRPDSRSCIQKYRGPTVLPEVTGMREIHSSARERHRRNVLRPYEVKVRIPSTEFRRNGHLHTLTGNQVPARWAELGGKIATCKPVQRTARTQSLRQRHMTNRTKFWIVPLTIDPIPRNTDISRHRF
jgi:hypothetical protein